MYCAYSKQQLKLKSVSFKANNTYIAIDSLHSMKSDISTGEKCGVWCWLLLLWGTSMCPTLRGRPSCQHWAIIPGSQTCLQLWGRRDTAHHMVNVNSLIRIITILVVQNGYWETLSHFVTDVYIHGCPASACGKHIRRPVIIYCNTLLASTAPNVRNT